MSFDCDQYFCVGRTATRIADAMPRARARFAERHALLCRPGLDTELLAMLAAFCARARFRPQEVEGLGHRHVETPPIAGGAIQLALNRKELKDWLMAVTGCGPLSHIEGRVVQTRAGGLDHLDWHKDTHENMRLGMTIHLTDCRYDGGAFELREIGAHKLSFRHDEPKAGDIVLFDIDGRLEHRVCPVASGEPRLVFVGWFFRAKSA
jgi:hypothetical protein